MEITDFNADCGDSSPSAESLAAAHEVRPLIHRLEPRLRLVIMGLFFEDRTLEDIGRQLHLTRERVRQLKEIALEELRNMICTT